MLTMYMDFPPGMAARFGQEFLLDGWIEGAAEGGKVVTREKIRLASKYSGLELVMQGQGDTYMRCCGYLVQDRLYQLILLGKNKEAVKSKEATKFFGSFELLEVPKSPEPPGAAVAADAKSERANLQGKWVVTALTVNGEEVPEATLRQIPWVWMIDDKKIISKRPGAGGKVIHEEEIEFALDPSKTPKTVDVTDVAKKETSKGIYEVVDDDILKICMPMKPTGDRPTAFTAKKGSEQVSIRMVRVSRPVTIETPKPRLELEGHTASIDGVAFSPDGKTVASAAYDQTVRLWDAATGKPKGVLKAKAGLEPVVFSPDGKTLVAAGRGGLIQMWDAATGKPTGTLDGHDNIVQSVAFSPDGNFLASASQDKTAKIWDLATGKVKTNIPYGGEDFVFAVAFSPDGGTLAVGSGGPFRDTSVHLYDVATGKRMAELPGHYGGVYGVAFSADGKLLASVGWSSIRKLWDVETKKEKVQLKEYNNTYTRLNWAVFSPDGKILATQSGTTTDVCLWDTATGKLIVTFNAHDKNVSAAAFSPDGKTLGTVSWDQKVKLWDLPIAKSAKK